MNQDHNENNEDRHEKWSYIPDHSYITLIIGGSGSGKTNVLLNLIKEQDSHNVIDRDIFVCQRLK